MRSRAVLKRVKYNPKPDMQEYPFNAGAWSGGTNRMPGAVVLCDS